MSERRKTFRAKSNPPSNNWDAGFGEQVEDGHKDFLRGEYPVREVPGRILSTAVQRVEIDDEY